MGEQEQPPGEFPNRTANRPTQRVLLFAQVQVILRAYFEQIKQLVFGVDKFLVTCPGKSQFPLSRLPHGLRYHSIGTISFGVARSDFR